MGDVWANGPYVNNGVKHMLIPERPVGMSDIMEVLVTPPPTDLSGPESRDLVGIGGGVIGVLDFEGKGGSLSLDEDLPSWLVDPLGIGHLDKWVIHPTYGWWNPYLAPPEKNWVDWWDIDLTESQLGRLQRITFLVTGVQTVTLWEAGWSCLRIVSDKPQLIMGHVDGGLSDANGTIYLGNGGSIRDAAVLYPIEWVRVPGQIIHKVQITSRGHYNYTDGNYPNNTRGIKDLTLHFT